MRKVIMQNAPAQSVNEREKVGCFRNNTPNHTLTDLKARQSSKIREIGNALITTGFVSLDAQAFPAFPSLGHPPARRAHGRVTTFVTPPSECNVLGRN